MVRHTYKALLILLFSSSVQAAQLIKGDSAAVAPQTFSFVVNKFATSGNDLYVGADQVGAGDFAIARLEAGADAFVGLIPLGSALVDKKINFLTTTAGQTCPVAVADGDPKRMHLLSVQGQSINVLTTPELKDAANNITNGIVGIGGGPNIGFAAVEPLGGAFGDANGGIAVASLAQVDVAGVRQLVFGQLGVTTPLDKSSVQVAFGGVLTAMSVSAFHWSTELDRLYIALTLSSGANGAMALLVGRLQNNQLILESAAPVGAFAGNNMVGTTNAATTITLNRVTTMRTTTRLDYAIVAGEIGAGAATSVRALPLVNNKNNAATHGTIADNTQTLSPLTILGFQTPATTPAQMVNSTTNPVGPAVVGGGNLPDPLGEVFVQGDAVFATTTTNPAIYYSRALFDEQGKIRSWTAWQRAQMFFDAANAAQQYGGFLVDAQSGLFTAMLGAPGAIQTVERTVWADGATNGYAQLAQELKTPTTFARVFPQIDPVPGIQATISLMITAGNGSVTLTDLGVPAGPNFATFSANKVAFSDGAITAAPAATTQIVSIAGGALNQVGEIATTEIAVNADGGYLFVGGPLGLAVLSDVAGTGWAGGLGVGFTQLTAGMSFKKVGNYSYVRKIIYDFENNAAVPINPVLYVLTDKTLDRIDLTAGNIGLGQFTITRLADVATLPDMPVLGSLQDVVISGKFAVLATTVGMLRVGSGANIATATNQKDVAWTSVAIPEASGPVIKLLAITVNEQERSLGQQIGVVAQVPGNLYVLSSYNGNDRARLNRFTVQDVSGANPVTNSTLQIIPDAFKKNIPSYLVSYGLYQDLIATDGAIHLSARSRNRFENPGVFKLSGNLTSGQPLAERFGIFLPLNIESNNIISAMMRNPATGSWFITGDFGLKAGE